MPKTITFYFDKELCEKYNLRIDEIRVLGKFIGVIKHGESRMWLEADIKKLEDFIKWK